MKTPKLHPFCERFPRMFGHPWNMFKKSIKEEGLQHPIVLFQGMVLDGQNRLRACKETGVEPRYVNFEGTIFEARRFVVRENARRRHMNQTQRMIWAYDWRLWLSENPDFCEQDAKTTETLAETLKPAGHMAPDRPKTPLETVVEELHVPARSVKRAGQFLRKAGKPLEQLARSGAVNNLDALTKVANLPKPAQAAIVAKGPEAVLAAARAATPPRRQPILPPHHASKQPGLAPGSTMSAGCGLEINSVKGPLEQALTKSMDSVRAAQVIEMVVAKIEATYEQYKVKWNQPPPPAPRQIIDAIIKGVRA